MYSGPDDNPKEIFYFINELYMHSTNQFSRAYRFSNIEDFFKSMHPITEYKVYPFIAVEVDDKTNQFIRRSDILRIRDFIED